MVPLTPARRSELARAERLWSAASTSAGGRSRPARAAVPACSSHLSTRASRHALLALAGSGRIGGQDGTAGGDAQLPGGQARSVIENLLLDGGCMLVAEA